MECDVMMTWENLRCKLSYQADTLKVDANKSCIITMRKSGFSPREICRELVISWSMVYRWIRRWEEQGALNACPLSSTLRKTTKGQYYLHQRS